MTYMSTNKSNLGEDDGHDAAQRVRHGDYRCRTGRLFMANLMGLSGHRVVPLERNEGLCPLPRAIAFDDETLRSLAQIGVPAIAR
jgi:hypothetical protein